MTKLVLILFLLVPFVLVPGADAATKHKCPAGKVRTWSRTRAGKIVYLHGKPKVVCKRPRVAASPVVNQAPAAQVSEPAPTPTPTTPAPPPEPFCKGYVGLTFDDGPTDMTQNYLDVLRVYGARVTFFTIGNNVQTADGQIRARAMIAAGHDIADHSMTHPHLERMAYADVKNEISKQLQAVKDATGITETMFRPPYGGESPATYEIAESLGLTHMTWTYDPEDWNSPPTSQLVTNVLANSHDQAIILLHEGQANTLAAIPGILDGLHQMRLCPGRLVRDTSSKLIDPWKGGYPQLVAVRAW